MKETILILGGYGNTGKLIAETLLPECDASIIVAGRDGARARSLPANLLRKSIRAGDRPAAWMRGIHLH